MSAPNRRGSGQDRLSKHRGSARRESAPARQRRDRKRLALPTAGNAIDAGMPVIVGPDKEVPHDPLGATTAKKPQIGSAKSLPQFQRRSGRDRRLHHSNIPDRHSSLGGWNRPRRRCQMIHSRRHQRKTGGGGNRVTNLRQLAIASACIRGSDSALMLYRSLRNRGRSCGPARRAARDRFPLSLRDIESIVAMETAAHAFKIVKITQSLVLNGGGKPPARFRARTLLRRCGEVDIKKQR